MKTSPALGRGIMETWWRHGAGVFSKLARVLWWEGDYRFPVGSFSDQEERDCAKEAAWAVFVGLTDQ